MLIPRPHHAQFAKDKMVEHSLNTRKFAELVGVSPSYISQVMNGKRPPSDNIAKTIADLLCDTHEEREYYLFCVGLAQRVSFIPETRSELEIYRDFEARLLANYYREKGAGDDHQISPLAG